MLVLYYFAVCSLVLSTLPGGQAFFSEGGLGENYNPNQLRVAANRLYETLFRNYNKLVLPVASSSDKVDIRLLLRLISLAKIDEKNQIMTSTVWIKHEWRDSGLVWNPNDYGNISKIQLPADDIWIPDTVLYNNADGDYQITIKTKVTVYHDGAVVWVPPAIYKSFCAIDVQFFPFDEQVCDLKFGPWAYDTSKVDYWLYDFSDGNRTLTNFLSNASDLQEFSESVEWDILKVSGKRTVWEYTCCPEKYVDITYRIYLRRKALFYTINLIIPCVCISLPTIFVFYLPSQSCERITLSVSVLVALILFILVLYEIIPPTSLALPLMSKYLLFTIILITLSIILTICTLTLHFRHPHSYKMPYWVRRLVLELLPKMIFYSRPHVDKKKEDKRFRDPKLWRADGSKKPTKYDVYAHLSSNGVSSELAEVSVTKTSQQEISACEPLCQQGTSNGPKNVTSDAGVEQSWYENVTMPPSILSIVEDIEISELLKREDLADALESVHVIAQKLRGSTEEKRMREDWEEAARVIDRLFLIIFGGVVIIGTCSIIITAPALYDNTPALGPTSSH